MWTLEDFMKDYPGGYVSDGVVYNHLCRPVGYATEDGNYRIDNDPINSGKIYHIPEKKY